MEFFTKAVGSIGKILSSKTVMYIILSAVVVYVVKSIADSISSLSSTIKKIIPWVAGIAALVTIMFVFKTERDEHKAVSNYH